MSEIDRYNQGLQDAWELAKKIAMEKSNGGFDSYEIVDIFGFNDMDAIFMSYSPQEALAKFKAFEDVQKEIKVGDVVRFKTDHDICLVVTKLRADAFDAINESGATYSGRCYGDWEKTGQHIDIESVLEQIKKV